MEFYAESLNGFTFYNLNHDYQLCLVFVPSSCIPLPVMPWNPVAKKTKIGKNPALLETSKTMCVWAGSIEIQDPGTKKIQIT